MTQNPGLFGINNSNRDLKQKEAWGKNCFNSSFPASLSCYLYSRSLDNIYLKINSDLEVFHDKINASNLYGIKPDSDNLFYAFETQFTPYQKYIIGTLPNVDLVTQNIDSGVCLRGIEIKLTALPDHTTCKLPENLYGCEIVIRPDTIVYLACSIVSEFRQDINLLRSLIDLDFDKIPDPTEPKNIIPHIPRIISIIDTILRTNLDKQNPFLMQPIWKTEGKSPRLAKHCLDVFVWSDLAFTRLFIDLIKSEIIKYGNVRNIGRHTRTAIWLYKMIHEFSIKKSFNHRKIIDIFSYNTKNDKAFSIAGRSTHRYMKLETLTKPRIEKAEIKRIILGGGQNLLSPERRLDAIIYNSPGLFD